MSLTQRTRKGVKISGTQKKSEAKIGAVAIAAILVILLALLLISNVRKNQAAKYAAEVARREASDKAERKKEREMFLQNEADRAAGIVRETQPTPPAPLTSADYGSAMGHMIAMMGKSYPTDSEIEQMAKTKAVDAGHRPNNPIFISSFKAAFADGYAAGRKKYNAR